ncbi:MAG: PAS domain-containing protein [Deltaproteobacteria bacterium]|nr:PAS domain-containing protein [Deltaproteobacteria bacterium]
MEDTDSREQIGQLQNIIAELQAANRELADVNACLHVRIEEQEERTRRFASFPHLNPNPVLEVAASGEVTFFNPASQKILVELGLSQENISDFLPVDMGVILRDLAQQEESTLYREVALGERIFAATVHLVPQFAAARIYAYDITERKRAEESLRTAHAELEIRVRERTAELHKTMEALGTEQRRFVEVLDMLPVYVVLLAPDYHVPFANRFFRERFGESAGRRCFEYLFGRNEPCEVCETFKVLQDSKPREWEWTGPDGRIYSIFDFPFADADGSPLILEMGIDITELTLAEAELAEHRYHLEDLVGRRTRQLEETNEQLQEEIDEREIIEEALQKSNGKLALLAESARLLLTSESPERIVRTICEKVMEHLGCHVFFNYLVDKTGQRMHLNAYAGIGAETAAEIEWLDFGEAVCGCVALDGRRMVAEDIANSSDERAGIVRALGIQAYACHPLIYQDRTLGTLSFGTRDRAYFSLDELELMSTITGQVAIAMARKQAEGALLRAKQEWERTFDSVPDLIAILDKEHRILRVNRAMAERLEATPDQCVDLNCYQCVHGMSGPPAFCPHSLSLIDGKEHVAEVHEDRLGGDFLVTTTPLLDEEGKMLGTVHVSRDITERKRDEEKIRKLNDKLKNSITQLAAANRELEAFSSSVSHDLRAPLRSIAGFSQVLQEDYADRLDEEGRDALERILAGTHRMGRLIDDLLNLSRVTRAEMRRERVNLSGLAERIAESLAKSQPERQVEWRIAPDVFVEGDEHLLLVALDNLLRNAFKFTAKQPAATIEFGATEQPDGEKVYFVKDNGAGFDMSYAGKLFSPFQRLHTTSEFPGTGIGLATVKRIINRHGGRVWIEGEPDKGTVVFFAL